MRLFLAVVWVLTAFLVAVNIGLFLAWGGLWFIAAGFFCWFLFLFELVLWAKADA